MKRTPHRIKRKRISRTPKTTIPKLTKELDTYFSRFIRLSRLDEEEKDCVRCYTCGHLAHWKKIHAGHFISRWYKSTRWNENNVRPQCVMCNIYKKGDTAKFRRRLVAEIGLEEVEKMELESAGGKMGKLDKEELEKQIRYYAHYTEQLITDLNSSHNIN